jgi:hypothetical protein
MSRVHLLALIGLFAATSTRAADRKEIDAAVQSGAAYLKKAGGNGRDARDPDRVGATALAGLALLETGTPADDPALKKITAAIRDASYTQTQTYQIALCILYLDRHGDPADRLLIQMLGVRLLAGQNASGGWTYGCISPVPPGTERFLRTHLSEATLTAGGKEPAAPAPKPDKPTAGPHLPAAAGKLHADVEKYRQGLLGTDTKGKGRPHDDNSNSQFGVLGVWTARKHGVPVENALVLIEKRYLATQNTSGGWPYSGPAPGPDGSPSMTCAGLIGLATSIGHREERVLKAEVAKPPAKKPDETAKPNPPPGTDPNDPFFNPPPNPPTAEPAKKPDAPPAPKPKRPAAIDAAVNRGMDHLADALAGRVVGKGPRMSTTDLYFLWSMERVGVIYGVDKFGKTDWYEYAADQLVSSQNPNGSWGGRDGDGPVVETAFALLVLARSNLARDLSSKVQKELGNTELRAGAGPSAIAPKPEPAPMPMPPADPPTVKPVVPVLPDPAKPTAKPEPAKPEPAKPIGTTPADIAAELFRSTGANWAATLQKVRDAKGPENTSALLAVIPLLDNDRKKTAREALAERLCRMSAATLRTMLKSDDAELRRASALACAMKDDKEHVPDLIDTLEDKDADVAKAARAGLKSLTGKDFATAAEWRAWYKK